MATKVLSNSLPAASSPRNTKTQEAKAPKKAVASKKPKSSPSHPTFQQMITEAIVALNERTGSSQYAITKYIEEKHKQLPPNFKKLVFNGIKKLVAAGKLVKIKNSFKLPSTRSISRTELKPKPAKAVTAGSKPKAKAPSKSNVAAKATTAGAKRKATEAPTSSSAKVARTSVKVKSPGKKLAKPAKKIAVKKVKSVRSPTKKAKK